MLLQLCLRLLAFADRRVLSSDAAAFHVFLQPLFEEELEPRDGGKGIDTLPRPLPDAEYQEYELDGGHRIRMSLRHGATGRRGAGGSGGRKAGDRATDMGSRLASARSWGASTDLPGTPAAARASKVRRVNHFDHPFIICAGSIPTPHPKSRT